MLISKKSDELVFDLINAANPQLDPPLTVNNAVVEAVTAVTPSADNGQRNTKAKVRGLQGDGYLGRVELFFDRLNLETLFGDSVNNRGTLARFVTFTAPDVHAAIDVIVDTYGINFTVADLVNRDLASPNTPNYVGAVQIDATPTSKAYCGAKVVMFGRGLPRLDESIKTADLDTLQHPIPVTTKRCIDMLTWGIDFTGYASLLTSDSTGMPHWTEFRAALTDIGIPDYPGPADGNYVTVRNTSDLPQANKKFKYVLVHTGIDAAEVKGVAYYHFN